MIADEDLAGLGYSERRLGQIELYLAAHFCHISHAQIRSEEYGDTKVSYRGFDSQDLRSSSYGQTAINLDTSRKLDSLGKGTAYAEVL